MPNIALQEAPPLPQILREGNLQPVATVAHQLTGRRPSPPTIHRWVRIGVGGGVKLTVAYHAGKWMTTTVAFNQFLAEQTAARMASYESESDAASDDDLRAVGLL